MMNLKAQKAVLKLERKKSAVWRRWDSALRHDAWVDRHRAVLLET